MSVYFLAALSEDAEGHDWVAAMKALNDLYSPTGWGSAARRASIRQLARGRFLPAFQAVAVAIDDVPTELLAVLAADGSEASLDALMPHFQRAATRRDAALDQLERVRVHAAKTRAVASLFESVERLFRARNDASPTLALAKQVGLGDVDRLVVHVSVSSSERTSNRAPLYQGGVEFDSTSDTWFRVWVAKVDHRFIGGSLEFTNAGSDFDDPLETGVLACAPTELPRWLAALGKVLGVRWVVELSRSNLRGAKRELFLSWLRDEQSAAAKRRPRRRARAGSVSRGATSARS